VLVVSHDREFLDATVSRLLYLDPETREVRSYTGGYSDFAEARRHEGELQADAWRRQEEYVGRVRSDVGRLKSEARAIEVNTTPRQPGVRRHARRKAAVAKSRERKLERYLASDERVERPRQRWAINLDFGAPPPGGRVMVRCEDLGFAYSGKPPLFEHVNVEVRYGQRWAVVGPNGSGKTTLLRTIIGELTPDAGTIERADQLRVVYFEQSRQSLDPNLTLRRTLAPPEGDTVVYRDRAVHVAGWAKRFLFRGEQLDTAVSRLSGGEKARVILARLMLQPADLLVLDEPTNDLDIPTLDVLEESLLEFPGALVLVTHDRYLLDRVSTRILALDGRGGAELFADYAQWDSERRAARPSRPDARPAPPPERTRTNRLSYLEQREWDAMEATLLAAESRLDEAQRRAEDPAIASDAAALQERLRELGEAKGEVDRLYARWAELERRATP